MDGLNPGSADQTLSPSVAIGALFVAASGAWLLARWRAGRAYRPSLATLGTGGLVLAASLSCLVSRVPSDSISGTVRLLAAWLMFVVTEQLLRAYPGIHRRLLAVITLATVGVVAWALIGMVTRTAFVDPGLGLMRANGPFVHPNVLAKFLAITAMPLTALALWSRGPRRVWAVALLVPLTVTLGMTATRVAWIAAALGLTYLLSRVSWKFIPPLMVALLTVAALIPSVRQRIVDLGAAAPSVGTPENSLVWRWQYWQELFTLHRMSPINGTGLDTIPTLGSYTGLNAHNVWVQSYVEMGYVGLLALAVAVVCVTVGLYRARGTVPPVRHHVAVAVALTVLVTTLTENLLSETATIWYAAVLITSGWVGTRPESGREADGAADTVRAGSGEAPRARCPSAG